MSRRSKFIRDNPNILSRLNKMVLTGIWEMPAYYEELRRLPPAPPFRTTPQHTVKTISFPEDSLYSHLKRRLPEIFINYRDDYSKSTHTLPSMMVKQWHQYLSNGMGMRDSFAKVMNEFSDDILSHRIKINYSPPTLRNPSSATPLTPHDLPSLLISAAKEKQTLQLSSSLLMSNRKKNALAKKHFPTVSEKLEMSLNRTLGMKSEMFDKHVYSFLNPRVRGRRDRKLISNPNFYLSKEEEFITFLAFGVLDISRDSHFLWKILDGEIPSALAMKMIQDDDIIIKEIEEKRDTYKHAIIQYKYYILSHPLVAKMRLQHYKSTKLFHQSLSSINITKEATYRDFIAYVLRYQIKINGSNTILHWLPYTGPIDPLLVDNAKVILKCQNISDLLQTNPAIIDKFQNILMEFSSALQRRKDITAILKKERGIIGDMDGINTKKLNEYLMKISDAVDEGDSELRSERRKKAREMKMGVGSDNDMSTTPPHDISLDIGEIGQRFSYERQYEADPKHSEMESGEFERKEQARLRSVKKIIPLTTQSQLLEDKNDREAQNRDIFQQMIPSKLYVEENEEEENTEVDTYQYKEVRKLNNNSTNSSSLAAPSSSSLSSSFSSPSSSSPPSPPFPPPIDSLSPQRILSATPSPPGVLDIDNHDFTPYTSTQVPMLKPIFPDDPKYIYDQHHKKVLRDIAIAKKQGEYLLSMSPNAKKEEEKVTYRQFLSASKLDADQLIFDLFDVNPEGEESDEEMMQIIENIKIKIEKAKNSSLLGRENTEERTDVDQKWAEDTMRKRIEGKRKQMEEEEESSSSSPSDVNLLSNSHKHLGLLASLSSSPSLFDFIAKLHRRAEFLRSQSVFAHHAVKSPNPWVAINIPFDLNNQKITEKEYNSMGIYLGMYSVRDSTEENVPLTDDEIHRHRLLMNYIDEAIARYDPTGANGLEYGMSHRSTLSLYDYNTFESEWRKISMRIKSPPLQWRKKALAGRIRVHEAKMQRSQQSQMHKEENTQTLEGKLFGDFKGNDEEEESDEETMRKAESMDGEERKKGRRL